MTNSTHNAKRVLVIGDAMVDSYLTTSPAGISDEAPVMVLDWQTIRHALGGMMNVAASIAAEASIKVATLAGAHEHDDSGIWMREKSGELGLDSFWFSDGRPTIEKMRVGVVDENTHVARIDHEHTYPLEANVAAEVERTLERVVPSVSAIVVSDYDKGMMSDAIVKTLMRLAQESSVPVFVDAKPSRMPLYRGASWWTPNESEARSCVTLHGWDAATEDTDAIAGSIAGELGGTVVVTCDARGVVVATGTGEVSAYPAIDEDGKSVQSTSGAGDVFLASLVIAHLRGYDPTSSITFARERVAACIRRDGTCTLTASDLG